MALILLVAFWLVVGSFLLGLVIAAFGGSEFGECFEFAFVLVGLTLGGFAMAGIIYLGITLSADLLGISLEGAE